MTSGVTPARGAEAEEILARDYERLRGDVVAALRGKLVAQRVHVDASDLDAFYNQAWHTLYSRLAEGAEVENHTGFLVTVGYRRAIDEIRRLQPDHLDDGAEVTAVGVDVDFAGRLDDAATVRHLVEGMRERLNEREQRAAALCLIHGYTRPEAAEVLDVTPRRMEKIMDGVTRKLARLTGEISDDWCRSRESLISAYALGLLDEGGERHAAAVEHLRECSACRRYVNTRRGLASIIPPVWLPLAASGAVAAGVGGGVAGGGGIGGLLHRLRPRGRSHTQVVAGAGGSAAAIAAVVLVVTGTFDGSDRPAPVRAAQPPPATTPAPPPRSTPALHRVHRHAAPPAHRRRRRTHHARTAVVHPHTTVVAATPTTVTPPPAPPVQPTPPPAAPPAAPPAPPAPHKAHPLTDGAQEFGPEH